MQLIFLNVFNIGFTGSLIYQTTQYDSNYLPLAAAKRAETSSQLMISKMAST